MNKIITARDLAMVTSDIQYAQRQGARQLASNLIEIGRLLVEAKTMVAPADWEKYIWDNFGYSTSSADNWMKLYREYGDNQESLFDSFTNSQTFGKLSYTQLLALTALPAEERSEFVESHDVENMSTRQLQQAIRERDEARQAQEEAELRAEEMERLAEKRKQDADHDAEEANRLVSAQKLRAETAEQAKTKAEKSELNALKLVEKLNKQLAAAEAAEKTAKADLERAREKPDIPESVMERLRREAEAAAAEKATEEIQKQLAEAEEKAKKETQARVTAEAAAREAQEKLVAAQRATKLSDPDMMSVNLLGQQMLSIWNSIKGYRMKAVAADSANAGPIDAFLKKVLDTMRDSLFGEG